MSVVCSCGFEPPEGCTCGWGDSATIAFSGVAGQPSQRRVTEIIDPRADNLLTGGPSGLLATLPSRFRNPPSARVYRSTTLGTLHDIATTVNFDTASFDTDGIWAGSSDFIIRTPGLYIITYSARWASNSSGKREAAIQINGARICMDRYWPISGTEMASSVVATWLLDAGSTVTFAVRQNSGGTLNLQAANATTANSFNTASLCYVGDAR